MLQSHSKDDKISRYLSSDIHSFQDALYSSLRDEVTKIIKTDGSWSVGSILNQDVAKEMLNNILWWLFDDEPERSLAMLEQLNNPQHICGHIFKPGEPTYSCRDCAVDPTCVFCQHCFRQSEHKKHRYKMHTSGGGGCCDCGDLEAWTKHPACSLHKDSEENMDAGQDPVSRLPDVVRERAPHFFQVLLTYVVDMLTNERTVTSDLPEALRPSDPEDCHIVMLYNDESHTFDYVIDILKKALGCDENMGSDFATIVDREGRSVVCIDKMETCEKVKKTVNTPPTPLFHFRTNEPLKTLIIHISIVAHQELALLILPWLSRIVQQSEGLRNIFSEIALKELIQVVPQESSSGSGMVSPIEQFIRCDETLWKTARNLYHQLSMNCLLLEAETKKKFAVLFTRLYDVVQEGFLKGDHDHGQSVASLAVQLFTVPTIARHLIIHENVLSVIMKVIMSSCCNVPDTTPTEWLKFSPLNSRRMRNRFRRMQYCFYDLKYILSNTLDQMSDELKSKFIDGTKMVIQMMMAMQGMDATKRRSDRHIEHEPEWETGITLMMRFSTIIHHLLQWCKTDKNTLGDVLGLCLTALEHLKSENPESMKLCAVSCNGKEYECVEYDVTKQFVSSHYPLTRLTAALLVELGKMGVTWTDAWKMCDVTMEMNFPLRLMECSLRSLALAAQVNSGMWRRNGLALVNQIFYYRDCRCRTEGFERDVQMLQACAAAMNPDHFIACLLHKLKLNPEPPEFAEYHINMTGEFFRLLIAVCGERHVPGVGDVTINDQMRRQVVHVLAIEPKPHSKVAKLLPEVVTGRPEWEDLLHQVADFKEARNISGVGRYELKTECFTEFCPFSYQYTTPTDETKAHQEILRRKTEMKMSTVFVPPRLPRFTPLFSNVTNILSSDLFVHRISVFLQELSTGQHEQWTDKLVEKAFYLIGMAIVENEQQLEADENTTFDFVKKCVAGCEKSILFLLRQLEVMDAHAMHRDTIRWLISKIEQLSEQRLGASTSVDPERMSQQNEQARETENVKTARKRKAQELRDKLLNQMKVMQQEFLSKNPELMSEETVETPMEMSQESNFSQDVDSPVCTDLSWQLQATKTAEPSYTCILCQEETQPADGSVVMSALVQQSTVLTRGPRTEPASRGLDPLFVDLSFPDGVHVSTCSHTMHYDCFKQFRDSVFNESRRRHHHRFTRKGYNVNNNEFLCPLCSRLSNTVIPIIPQMVVAKQRGIVTDSGEDQLPSTSVDLGPPTLKVWMKAIEEILSPAKHEKQEVVLKFHVDVTDLKDEMDKAEPTTVDAEGESTSEAASFEKLVKEIVGTKPKTVDQLLQEGLQAALDDYTQMTQTVGSDGVTDEVHFPKNSWLAVSTTVITAEMVARLDNLPVLAKSPIRISSALTGVIRSAVACSATSSPEMLSDIRIQSQILLESLLGSVKNDESSTAILTTNIFSTFVSLWFSTLVLRRSKQMKDHPVMQETTEFEKHLLFLCTLAQIVQIFLFLDVESFKEDVENIASTSSTEDSSLYQACVQVRTHAGLPPLPSKVTEGQLTKVIQECLHPYIRCCALFLHHVTGVPAPTRLEHSDNQRALLRYLGLPKNLTEFFDVGGQLSLDPLIQKWCKHPQVLDRISAFPAHLSFPPVSQVPDIIPFPHDYSDLIGAVSLFKCPKFASEDSLCPTMCLVCGVVLCSQSYCCQQALPPNDQQVGACTFHAYSCSAGSGIFLRVREATIVLLHGVYRGCFVHAPYLDKYGEADRGLRRGNPLYLNQGRLLELRKLWLSHGIAERVSHDIESKHMGRVLDWAHL